MSSDTQELLILQYASSWVTLNSLLNKGILSYDDIQRSIAEVRDMLPKEMYTPLIANMLNIMEQTYQSGPYQSPLDPPDEPRP